MISRRAGVVALWLACVGAAAWVVAHASFVSDMSAFLPAQPTPLQKLLVDQLRDGPASRLILIALEHGSARARAGLSKAMALRLREDPGFSSVANGADEFADRDREFLFGHRYLLSKAVTPGRFTADGLHSAIADTIQNLASPAGVMLKSLVPRDPTGEVLQIIDQLGRTQAPRTADGVWVSADGARTLLVAQTAASGSDTDAQERDMDVIRGAFRSALMAAGSDGAANSAVQYRLSGPGVFAVEARAKIKRAAERLSLVSSLLVIGVLLTVYRSVVALGLGVLPVATGALLGIAAVALTFGAVHGITLGFGITLIGESVDYSIYFFIASAESWRRRVWPTVRLGVLVSVCGFASLLPAGFPGLAQLGVYSISGLIAAVCVTRFVLPELLPRGFTIRDVAPLGRRIGRIRDAVRRGSRGLHAAAAAAIAVTALLVLYRQHDGLWNRELARLSPVAAETLQYDALLRADLGAANVLDVVIVGGSDLETVLRGAERAGSTLAALTDANIIGDFDSPANYLPSLATQRARRDALPDAPVLREALRAAVADFDLDAGRLTPFLADMAAARRAPLLELEDLHGTSLEAGFNALILKAPGHWSALLPLHAVAGATPPEVDVARVAAALAAAHLEDTQVLDLKLEADALYAEYLREAIRASAGGLALIVLLLLVALRSPLRVARILAPLVLAVLTVAAALAALGQPLTLLHLVGMLLIVAVGSNYALFFDAEADPTPLTLASLCVANLSTVIGFGLLSFSQVPVLVALGTTVAPGTLLALLFAALGRPNARS